MQTEIFKHKPVKTYSNERIRFNNDEIIAFVFIQFGIQATIKDYFPDTGMVGFAFASSLDYNTFLIELNENEHLAVKMKESISNTIWLKATSNKFIKQ